MSEQTTGTIVVPQDASNTPVYDSVVNEQPTAPNTTPVEGTVHKVLSFEEIMAAQDTNEVTLDIPEWGGSVVVKPLTKDDQRNVRKAARIPGGGPTDIDFSMIELGFLAKGMVQPKVTVEQARLLGKKSMAAVDKVLNAIVGESAMGEKVEAEAERTFLD
jgi:hypothetical protein